MSAYEFSSGPLSKGTYYRLVISGPMIGTKEIEVLIKKLQLVKEILADEGSSK